MTLDNSKKLEAVFFSRHVTSVTQERASITLILSFQYLLQILQTLCPLCTSKEKKQEE